MKILVQKEVEVEIEIPDFPIYRDHGSLFYKIESEKKIIGVYKSGGARRGIEMHEDGKWLFDILLTDTTPRTITEEEFKAEYRTAMSHIMREAFMQASGPATEEDIRAKIADEISIHLENCEQ